MNGGTKLSILIVGSSKVKKGFLIFKISFKICKITKYLHNNVLNI